MIASLGGFNKLELDTTQRSTLHALPLSREGCERSKTVTVASVAPLSPAVPADFITNLPGYTIDHKYLHYRLVESESPTAISKRRRKAWMRRQLKKLNFSSFLSSSPGFISLRPPPSSSSSSADPFSCFFNPCSKPNSTPKTP